MRSTTERPSRIAGGMALLASIAAGWGALRLSGGSTGGRGWIDRLGRAVGAGWLTALPASASICSYALST